MLCALPGLRLRTRDVGTLGGRGRQAASPSSPASSLVIRGAGARLWSLVGLKWWLDDGRTKRTESECSLTTRMGSCEHGCARTFKLQIGAVSHGWLFGRERVTRESTERVEIAERSGRKRDTAECSGRLQVCMLSPNWPAHSGQPKMPLVQIKW
ncbi:Hypothetical predicted protein [Pelobates cultripes]|uniref:Uncharacterized protein n=1 Tax=Pelobates cultripes TaxID=61616 RepID=A0AAD1SMK4_PELCU|nr:Hypothetical predicted protein [Pelobates cultripes]